MLDQLFWENRWLNGQTGWDLGAASPPLTAVADAIAPDNRRLAVLIPGCGNGYEALYLLQQGFTNITMLDIAPTAITRLKGRLDLEFPNWSASLNMVCADFFDISGQFDLILEQTFFCALDPSLRKAYVRKMHDLLKPGGQLAGVLFDRDFEGGPPFGGHREEYMELFKPFFHIKTMTPCLNSIPPRAGSEAFFVVEKKQ